MYQAIKSFAKDNPTMILTLCYVLITVIGTGYSFFFYREFDINIIKLADLSDFLLAAILEPLSLILFLFTILLMLLSYWLDLQFRKWISFYKRFTEKGLMSKYSDPIMMIIVVVIITVILMRDLAIGNADEIKKDGKDSYEVSFTENDSEVTIKKLELLGSTSRFVYFFDRINQQSVVISPENLSFMRKTVIQDKDKTYDPIDLNESKQRLNHPKRPGKL